MNKIIQIDSYSGLGGGQRIMFEIINGLKNKFNFVIVSPGGIFLKKYSELNFRVKELKEKNFLKIISEIKKIIKVESPNLLHIQGTRAAFWTRLALIFLERKPKVIYTLHGFHIIRKKLFFKWPLIFLERFLNRYTTILICVSESDKKLVLKYRTIPENKIVVIQNGIDIEGFKVNEELVKSEKERLGLQDNFVLTTIGRLHPPKDFSTILRALKIIISCNKKFRLLIVGDGSLRESLEEETKNLELNQYVKFLGFREDIPILINLSDIIILSTKWEGLPLVPIEAGASRKPIIASDVDGVRETIIDEETGYLFNPGSVEDLVDKILKLSFSGKLREKMGEAGHRFVSKNFSKERMIREYQNLYETILK